MCARGECAREEAVPPLDASWHMFCMYVRTHARTNSPSFSSILGVWPGLPSLEIRFSPLDPRMVASEFGGPWERARSRLT